MTFDLIRIGTKVPKEVQVVIEIPAGSDPVKYEVDKETGALKVDRFMSTPMFYPINYGYIPDTLSLDGDPLDAMVLAPYPLISGSVILCRPIGLLKMTDESGEDAKILVVPVDKLTLFYKEYRSPDDVPISLRAAIVHFFEHYKDLEPGKWIKVEGWQDLAAAEREILDSVKRAT